MTDIVDIVERLRVYPTRLMNEAADEIAVQRHEIDMLRATVDACADYAAKIERLRAMDWREIAQRMWDGDYASVDDLAQAMEMAAQDRPRDDGTVIAVGGEPGASAGKSE